MKTLKRLSKKAIEFCEMSGLDARKVKNAMQIEGISINVCETIKEMDDNGVDYNYPYIIANPFNMNIYK